MSKRNKLQKFAELLMFPNVYENFDVLQPELIGAGGEKVERRGQWASAHFHNDHPITLELACGRGEYTLELARAYPERNFIGVDIKGARIWKGAQQALEEPLPNAAFLRTRIERISHFFSPGEVEEIWITFPDPFLKPTKAGRRLTHPGFLDEYRKILHPGGLLHLKTDSPELYRYTLKTLPAYGARIHYQNDNIYAGPLPYPELQFRTNYEHKHLGVGKTIKYVRFQLPPEESSNTPPD